MVKVLKKANSILLESSREVPKLLLLVSYEYPSEDPIEQILFEASEVKKQAHVFLAGVTLGRSHESKVTLWTNISTNSDSLHLYVVDEFTRLNSFLIYLIDNVCQHVSDGLAPKSTSISPTFTTSRASTVSIKPGDCLNLLHDKVRGLLRLISKNSY